MAERDPTDQELLVRWRAGEESAASVLVHRHAVSISRYLRSRGATADDLEDLTQEVFFRAFDKASTWRGDGSYRGWLFRIAINLLRDQQRRRGGRVLLTLMEDDRVDPSDPAQELEVAESAAKLAAGLAALSPMQREVFSLRVESGLNYSEVATALGTTVGAARVHYHHAVRRLKEEIR